MLQLCITWQGLHKFHNIVMDVMILQSPVYSASNPFGSGVIANAIGEALEEGTALAFLSQSQIAPQIDRVVAVFPDGRAFAWHQISPDTANAYTGSAPAAAPETPAQTPDKVE